ncbi:MAG: glycosyltransferase family 4 protein [Bacillota bacterium]
MRIALVIFHADPARGGAERYTLDLANSLRDRGHTIAMLATSFGDLPPGIERVQLHCHGWSRLRQNESFRDSLDAHQAQRQNDNVQAKLPVRTCDVYHPHAGIAAEAVCTGHEKHRNPIARTLAKAANQANRKRQRFAAIERELLCGARPPVVLCLSDYIKRAVQQHYPINDDCLVCLLNGVDLQRFDPIVNSVAREATRNRLGLEPDCVMALMIAQDFARKGLRQAIEALAQVRDSRLVLTVVGRDTVPPYRRLAERVGVADRVFFAGTTCNPVAFYQAADFFILPTRHDPCSLVVLESLAMGLPVISTRQNGACEAMANGQEGFILEDPDDVTRLAEMMGTLLIAAERERMRQACLTLRPTLSQEDHVRKLLEVYEQVQQKTLTRQSQH